MATLRFPVWRSSLDYILKAMKRPNSTTLRGHYGFIEAGYIERNLTRYENSLPGRGRKKKDMCLAAENWEMAVAIAADLVKAEPKNPTTWILLAHAVRHAGNVEQEETVLFKARAWHPTDPLIFLRLACCASVRGRIEEAKLRLEHAIDLDENVRWLALDEVDLRPLWDWISGLE